MFLYQIQGQSSHIIPQIPQSLQGVRHSHRFLLQDLQKRFQIHWLQAIENKETGITDAV